MRVSLHACVRETTTTAELVFPMKRVYKNVKVHVVSEEKGIGNKAKYICMFVYVLLESWMHFFRKKQYKEEGRGVRNKGGF